MGKSKVSGSGSSSSSSKKPLTVSKKTNQPKYEKKGSKTAAVKVTANPHVVRNIDVSQWKLIETVGEKQSDVVLKLHSEPWDFSHLAGVVNRLLAQNNDGSRFYLCGGQPHPYQNAAGEPKFSPTISIIQMPPPATCPPPFVALQNPQEGRDDFVPMEKFHLHWAPVTGSNDDGRVFALQRSGGRLTRRGEIEYEYATFWTMIPSKECKRKEDGVLDVQTAKFTYVAEGEEIVEEYTKGVDSFTDFCERHDLDQDEHKPKVKAAVKQGFDAVREKLESRLGLLLSNGYSESTLDTICVTKVYPCNQEINSVLQKSPYINQYYGSAENVY